MNEINPLQNVQKSIETSKLLLSKKESQRLFKNINLILEHVQQINSVDTSHINTFPKTTTIQYNPLRKDISQSHTSKTIKLAPETKNNFVIVPNVL